MNARLLILVSALAVSSALAQGFVNLDFESATIVPIPGDSLGRVQFAPTFPGWTGYFNGVNMASSALYNDVFIGSSGFALVDQNATFPSLAISHYTAVLQSGAVGFQPSVALAQTGQIPNGTASLRFLGSTFATGFIVTMNGQAVNPIALQSFGNYTEYGADISQFSGQTAELRFTRPAVATGSSFAFDNISFSSVGVPEPGVWALLGLGGALLWCATRRRKS